MAPKMGVENHTRAMNPRHGLVETDRASSFGFGHSGRTNSVIRGDEVQIPLTAPRTICTLRSVLLVRFPPEPTEVTRVASKGTVVISPIR